MLVGDGNHQDNSPCLKLVFNHDYNLVNWIERFSRGPKQHPDHCKIFLAAVIEINLTEIISAEQIPCRQWRIRIILIKMFCNLRMDRRIQGAPGSRKIHQWNKIFSTSLLRFCPMIRRRAQTRPSHPPKSKVCAHKKMRRSAKPDTSHIIVEKVARILIAIMFIAFNGWVQQFDNQPLKLRIKIDILNKS